ncbi:hypothetical protein FQN50_006837 [Emmonsiellopsis sp. PD_5]|nr:hypothetical protein FQN50_006837 [Emmonsiellopsis sp. PD_5]
MDRLTFVVLQFNPHKAEALCGQFSGLDLHENSDPHETQLSKRVKINGRDRLVDFFPASYTSPAAMLTQACRNCQGIVLAYDVTSRREFDRIVHDYHYIVDFWKDSIIPEPVARTTMVPILLSSPSQSNLAVSKDNHTGTFTPFARLPQELKLLILRQCLVSPHPVSALDPQLSGINMNILFTCKLFYTEGLRMFREQNTFTPYGQRIAIVGNTAWLTPTSRTKTTTTTTFPTRPRSVDGEEGEGLADRLGCSFVELSSRTDHEKVNKLFMDLAVEYLVRTEGPAPSGEAFHGSAVGERRGKRDRNRKKVGGWIGPVVKYFRHRVSRVLS